MLYLATVKFPSGAQRMEFRLCRQSSRTTRSGRTPTRVISPPSAERRTRLRHSSWETKGPTRCSIPSPIPCSRRSIDLGTSCTRRSRTRYSSPSSKRSMHSMKRTAPSGAPMRLGSWAITCSIRPCIRSCTSTSSSCAMRASRAFRARTAARCTLSSRASTTRWCSP